MRRKTFGVSLLGALCLGWSSAGSPAPTESFPPHPSVLLNANELAVLRSELARPGWKRELYHRSRGLAVMPSGAGIRVNADLWLKRPIQIPTRGGHFHYFFCEEGDQLEIPKDQQFVPGPYRCPKCGRQYSGEKYEGALRRIAHGWIAQAALDLALTGAIENNSVYTRKSAEILLRYAEAYPGPHTNTLTGGMIYQSLDESMWVIPLAQAYDLVYASLAPEERSRVEAWLRTVATGLQQCGTKGNWGSWHLSAVGVVGYALHDEPLTAWATAAFKDQIRNELGDDGLWPESVHTYHYFPLRAFLFFAEAAWHAGVDLYRWEGKPGKSLLSMLSAPLSYAYPDLRLPAINDGWFQSFVPADCYELAYYRIRDPHYGWVLTRGYRPGVVPAGVVASASRKNERDGLYAFLFGGDIPTHTTPPPMLSTNFPVLGTALLRSANGAMLTFDYGPYLSHGQPDKMGITLYAANRLWAADYGTPGYGAQILQWYRSTFAHNTIVVDGVNQKPTHENQARLWRDSPDFEAVQSETRAAYPGVTHNRTVARLGDCFVVVDRLNSEREHAYDFYLHSEGSLILKTPAGKGEPAGASVRWIHDLESRQAAESISGDYRLGRGVLSFVVLGTSPLTAVTGRCPADTGSRTIPLLIARQKARSAEFITVLFPHEGRQPLSVQRRQQVLAITHGAVTDCLDAGAVGQKPHLIR